MQHFRDPRFVNSTNDEEIAGKSKGIDLIVEEQDNETINSEQVQATNRPTTEEIDEARRNEGGDE